MKKILFMILTGFALLSLSACNENNAEHAMPNQYSPQIEITETDTSDEAYETDDIPGYELNQVWEIKELGETIVSSGTFWEDWWNLRGMFAPEYIAWVDWEDLPEHITAARGFAFGQLLPESGFGSLDDIRNHLLQFYTENWVDSELFGDFSAFLEYDDILYIDGTRAGLARPDWETAMHTLIEIEGSRAVVETTVLYGGWHRAPYEEVVTWEVQYRFTFINGRIDNIVE